MCRSEDSKTCGWKVFVVEIGLFLIPRMTRDDSSYSSLVQDAEHSKDVPAENNDEDDCELQKKH